MHRTLAFIFSTILLIAWALPARAAERPNILGLVAEDFGPELACYGTDQVFSPNLDRLASKGVRYTRAYATAPVCSVSRSAFMTGMYQTTIGAHNHRSHRDHGYRLPTGVRVIPGRMREAGYSTANTSCIRKADASIEFRPHLEGTP
jgi:N-sulfoglucosamine sulfohydrolase